MGVSTYLQVRGSGNWNLTARVDTGDEKPGKQGTFYGA